MHLRLTSAVLFAALSLSSGLARAAPLAGREPRDDVFYQIMPIAWRDSDGDPQRFGDFGGMTASLPYLRSLGVTAVWMTPIFTSPAYHGYQHMPPNVINPWFGTEAQFWSFVASAHAESIKVFIDLVAYTVSQNSVYFTDSHLNPKSIYTDYLAYHDPHVGNSSFVGGSYTTWNGGTVGEVRWNLAHPPVTSLLHGWCQYWMDPNGDGNPADGVDGWRLDHVLPDEGWGYTTAWWQQWKAAILAKNPDAFTFAEQADWGSYGRNLLGAHDAAFTIPFMFAARSAIASESATGLYASMAATWASVPAGRTSIGILGNHDVDRLSSNTGNSAGRNRVAAAILMTQPFPPCVYFGDELGMRGTKGNWGTDANDIPMREPFKWNAVAGAPMSNYFVLNANAYNARAGRDNDGRSVAEQSGVSGSLLERYRSLIALRRSHEALRRGGYAPVPASSGTVWAFVRQAVAETLLVAINLAGSSRSFTLDLSAFELPTGSSGVRDIVSGATLPALTPANQSAYPLSLAAHSWAILSANVAPPPPPAPSPYDGREIPADLGGLSLAATQTAATSMGDNLNELDQLFLRPDPDALALGLTGNIDATGTGLALFFDTIPGGQDSLATGSFQQPPNGVPQLTGLGMDAGFTPDILLWVNLFGGALYVDRYTLATGGGGTHRYLGNSTVNAGTPLLAGGNNTNGLQAAFSDSNVAGVTAASAAGAASATFGFEARIPWADLGLAGAGGDIKVMAAIARTNGALGNQFLPSLGPGAAEPGVPPFSLKTVPGVQYVTRSTSLGIAPPPALARSGAIATPNPFRGGTRLAFTLDRPQRLRIDLHDVHGRRVRALEARIFPPGSHAVDWDGRDDAGHDCPAGLYFARLLGAGNPAFVRVVRVP